jgi:4'-phosphopantetheinyl transferase
VERLGRTGDLGGLGRMTLSAEETGGLLTEIGLLRRWVRKEAAVKATGDGLTIPLSDLTFSPPGAPARLVDWKGRPHLRSRTALRDLHPGGGYLACVAVITPRSTAEAVTVRERDAGPVLTAEPGAMDGDCRDECRP